MCTSVTSTYTHLLQIPERPGYGMASEYNKNFFGCVFALPLAVTTPFPPNLFLICPLTGRFLHRRRPFFVVRPPFYPPPTIIKSLRNYLFGQGEPLRPFPSLSFRTLTTSYSERAEYISPTLPLNSPL